MSPREFDQLVERAIAAIPAPFRKRIANVAFVVEAEPPRPGLLGLYQGRPLTLRSVASPFAEPDRITIYQGPHERMARDEIELERIVRDTVWHEVAHYFGMNEPQVRQAERRRAEWGDLLEAAKRRKRRKILPG
jgi:predicted Zn-dependent protease with MMP-like domain